MEAKIRYFYLARSRKLATSRRVQLEPGRPAALSVKQMKYGDPFEKP